MLNLTRQEQQVILFLISVALLGMGINFSVKKFLQVKIIVSISPDMGRIDLNKADKERLMDIPGIGEKLAARIIEYRKQKAGFQDREELKGIKGISDYKYEKLKEFLFVQ